LLLWWLEDVMAQPIAGLAEYLSGEDSHSIGAVAEIGEEGIKLRLKRAFMVLAHVIFGVAVYEMVS
jgi:hypothetical protein